MADSHRFPFAQPYRCPDCGGFMAMLWAVVYRREYRPVVSLETGSATNRSRQE